MDRFKYDKGSKWFIHHHGNVVLQLGGMTNIVSWRAAPAHISGPPEPVFQQCREIIDKKALPQEHANLLAVTQVFAGLRYNTFDLMTILGGRKAMIESPLIQELLAEQSHEFILKALKSRFKAVPPQLETAVRGISDPERLSRLTDLALNCHDLETFRAQV